jgi:hypothetical protein
MTTQTVVQLVWIPMAVIGTLVFGTGLFFSARMLRNVRVPFHGRAPLARLRRTKIVTTVLGAGAGLTLLVLAFAPGTAPVHTVIGHAVGRIPAIVGHPLPPGPQPDQPPAAVQAPAAAPAVTGPVSSPASAPGSTRPAPVLASPRPVVTSPAPVATSTAPAPPPSSPAPTPTPTDTSPVPDPSATPAPAPADTQPAPAPTPTPSVMTG